VVAWQVKQRESPVKERQGLDEGHALTVSKCVEHCG
jgi:hypothetical protein